MRPLLILILVILSLAGRAQAPRDKWGSATKEELTMAYCPTNPSADAAILNNYGHYYFNRHFYFSNPELRTFYHYQVRLKIFTDEGRKYATVSIPYRGYDEYEDVIEISGTTYNLDASGKVIKSKLKVKSAQWTKKGRNLWNCTFTLPDVKAGSVVEYTYKIASLDFARLRDWMFQSSIPILNSDMTLSTPNFYQFAFFSNMPQNQLTVIRAENSQYIQFYNINIYCNGNQLKLSTGNIPAFRKEIWMPDSSRQILKGEFILLSAITRPPEFSRFNDYYLLPYLKPLLLTTTEDFYDSRERLGLYTDIMAGYKITEGLDWESFVKKLGKMDGFGKNMIKAFENKGATDSFRRMEAGTKRMIAIYDYVKHNIKWNGEYRLFASNSLENIFEKKEGYSSDINLLLINLLSRSGIQAKPVLVSTRSYGNVYKELGFFRKFNHVIASVELGGKRFLLDATDPDRPYNLLSLEDLNGEGLLVGIQDYQWIPLANLSVSELHQTENIEITSGGNYKTEMVTSYSGYMALQKKQELLHSAPGQEKTIVENQQSEDLPLVVKNTGEGTLVNVNPDSIAFSPLSGNSPIENPFTSDQRLYPVDMKFERVIIRELNIQIPEGYTLVSYPRERSFVIQGEFVSCTLNPAVEQNTLKLQLKVAINNAYIPSQVYPDLKLFLETVKALEQESVVFKKTR